MGFLHVFANMQMKLSQVCTDARLRPKIAFRLQYFSFFYFNTSDIAAVIDGLNLCLMDTVCPGFASIMYSMKIIL